jgi:hypothetical protein
MNAFLHHAMGFLQLLPVASGESEFLKIAIQVGNMYNGKCASSGNMK